MSGPCQKPPVTATKAERTEAHRNKMLWKRDERARRYDSHRRTVVLWGPLANVSRRHPDHNLTPAEHARAKAGRLAL